MYLYHFLISVTNTWGVCVSVCTGPEPQDTQPQHFTSDRELQTCTYVYTLCTYMFVCTYICIYIRMYVCMYNYVYMYMYVLLHLCVCVTVCIACTCSFIVKLFWMLSNIIINVTR